MPVHIADMSSEVTAVEDELPLGDAEIERITGLVLTRLQERSMDADKEGDDVEFRLSSGRSAAIARR